MFLAHLRQQTLTSPIALVALRPCIVAVGLLPDILGSGSGDEDSTGVLPESEATSCNSAFESVVSYKSDMLRFICVKICFCVTMFWCSVVYTLNAIDTRKLLSTTSMITYNASHYRYHFSFTTLCLRSVNTPNYEHAHISPNIYSLIFYCDTILCQGFLPLTISPVVKDQSIWERRQLS